MVWTQGTQDGYVRPNGYNHKCNMDHVNLSDSFRWVSDGGYVQGLLFEVPTWSFRRVSDTAIFTCPAGCIAAVQTTICNFAVVLKHIPWSRHHMSPSLNLTFLVHMGNHHWSRWNFMECKHISLSAWGIQPKPWGVGGHLWYPPSFYFLNSGVQIKSWN